MASKTVHNSYAVGKKHKKEKSKMLSQGLTQLQIAQNIFFLLTAVRNDLAQQKLNVFLLVSMLVSILSLEVPQQCLLHYMMVTQVVWTLPFLDKLVAKISGHQMRVQTRVLLVGFMGWVSLRYTYGYVLIQRRHDFLLNSVFVLQSVILVQTLGAILVAANRDKTEPRMIHLGVGVSLLTPVLVAVAGAKAVLLLSAALLSLCVHFHRLFYQGNSAFYSFYSNQMTIWIGCVGHILIWPHSSSYYPPQPLVMLTLGMLALSRAICQKSPAIFLCLGWSVVMSCLLPGWSCLLFLVVIPHMGLC